MKLLVIIINKVEYLNDVLSLLVEVGISNATIIDSESIGHYLAYEVPVFAGLRSIIGDPKEHNKTLLAVVGKDWNFEELQDLMKNEKVDFLKNEIGLMFTVPLNSVSKPE